MHSVIKSVTFLGLVAAVTRVSAHGYVQGIDVDGTYYTGYLVTQYPYESNPPAVIGWTDTATDLGFVAPDTYDSGDIICHKSATNAKLSATVAAGKTIRMDWTAWPSSHHGPVIDYLARCSNDDCTTVDKATLEFFKIDQVGLISDSAEPGSWASDQLIANNNSWTITIPSTIAPGPYVLRHEIIALHSADNSDGAQNYPQCINLIVTGSGTDSPAGTLGEALYSETDPGILVNIYTTGLTYTIPGPTLYSAGATATAAPITATSAAAVVIPTQTTLVTSVKPASTSSAQAAVSTSSSTNDDYCEL